MSSITTSEATPFPWLVSIVPEHEDPRGPLWKIEGPDHVSKKEREGRYVRERRTLIGSIDGPKRNAQHAEVFFRLIRSLGAMHSHLERARDFTAQAKERAVPLGMHPTDPSLTPTSLLELRTLSLPTHNWEVEQREGGVWRVVGRLSRRGDLGIAEVFTSDTDASLIADAPIVRDELYDALEELFRWGNLLVPTQEHIFAQSILLGADSTENTLRLIHGLPEIPRSEIFQRQQQRIDLAPAE